MNMTVLECIYIYILKGFKGLGGIGFTNGFPVSLGLVGFLSFTSYIGGSVSPLGFISSIPHKKRHQTHHQDISGCHLRFVGRKVWPILFREFG